MELYIDESGSINNHASHQRHFVIAIICPRDGKRLRKAYKRFVAANLDSLRNLDAPKISQKTGKIVKAGNKMFLDGKFHELKGSMMDKPMKLKFLEFFTKEPLFDIYYIHLQNEHLTDKFCENTARTFNFSLKLALQYFFNQGLLPDEDYHIRLDERNEKTGLRHNLQEYLNTELNLNAYAQGEFRVQYFDSSCDKIIQIADVFANIFYSYLMRGVYCQEIEELKKRGVIKSVFVYPRYS